MLLKVGDLAKRTGLTVRTLHHYDAIGLLSPSGRSPAGYRLYARQDIERLHCIQALRQLDISLSEIATLLQGDASDLQTVIGRQIDVLDAQMARAGELRGRLKSLQEQIHSRQEPELDYWLSTLSMMNLYGRYFTLDELWQMNLRPQSGEHEFNELKAQLRDLMKAGVLPDDPRVLPLAKRWIVLSMDFAGRNARLIYKLDTLHRNEPDVHLVTGIDQPLLDYITRATAAYRLNLYARHLSPELISQVRPRFLKHYLEWPILFAQARELHDKQADPLSPEVLELASRWMALFEAVWGTDPALHHQVIKINETEPELISDMELGIEQGAISMVRLGITHLRQLQASQA